MPIAQGRLPLAKRRLHIKLGTKQSQVPNP
jgi:hypothetical protein